MQATKDLMTFTKEIPKRKPHSGRDYPKEKENSRHSCPELLIKKFIFKIFRISAKLPPENIRKPDVLKVCF